MSFGQTVNWHNRKTGLLWVFWEQKHIALAQFFYLAIFIYIFAPKTTLERTHKVSWDEIMFNQTLCVLYYVTQSVSVQFSDYSHLYSDLKLKWACPKTQPYHCMRLKTKPLFHSQLIGTNTNLQKITFSSNISSNSAVPCGTFCPSAHTHTS